ncbi:MAG: signal peptidase I [Streptosporangiaceae bacterium]|jgi:signal peptidase I
MTDDRLAHERALADAREPGRPGEPGATEPGQEREGSPMAGTAAQDEAAGSAEEDIAQKRPEKSRSFWRELPVLIVVALVIALVIKSFVVQAFYIPSSSMENTLDIGDKVLVNKLVYHFRSIEPGDIVVFNGSGSWDQAAAPAAASSNPIARLYDATLVPLFHSIVELFGTAPGQHDYIKRVIGVPGDHVACCNAHGQVTVNGVALRESGYLFPGNVPSSSTFSVTVPPGRLWVMGDHRGVSCDSRCHLGDPGGGTVPESQVIGRAFMIVWPPSRWRILPIPATFSQPGVDQPRGAALSPAGPAAPYLPLGAGFVGAVPLTWLQRRLRRRLRHR